MILNGATKRFIFFTRVSELPIHRKIFFRLVNTVKASPS